MKRIIKHPLERLHSQTIKLHQKFEPISLQLQNGVPTIWSLESDDDWKNYGEVIIWMIWIGEYVDEHLKYIGTLQFENGLVGHYFWEYKK